MESRWNDQEAALFESQGVLGLRVYSSRLLGREPSLVLHGGGNTSLKLVEQTLTGEEEAVMYIKGSGANLATIEASQFSPIRYEWLARLAALDTLTDEQWTMAMARCVIDGTALPPSVESPLHAILPYRYVDHTHPDALLAIGSTPNGIDRIRALYGELVVVVPYARSGFPIAKRCAQAFREQANDRTIGVVLMHHGLFTFGEHAREAYERTIMLVSMAEEYLKQHRAWHISVSVPPPPPTTPLRQQVARIRREVSRVAGHPMIMTLHRDAWCLGFVSRDDIAHISQQGPATPDHVIWTKYRPLLGADRIEEFRADYERYFTTFAGRVSGTVSMLDPAPRVILDPAYGIFVTGRTARDVVVTSDIYRNTMEIILRATALGGYRALPEQDIFELEYWVLEQAKVRQKQEPIFQGEIALVTGAASGIGRACVDAFLKRGAAVVGLDINPVISHLLDRPDFLGLCCDITAEEEILQALEQAVTKFGGLDMLVLNAGIFPGGKRIADLEISEWRRVLQVNLDANVVLMRECYPLLKLAPRRGRVAIIGSKNVPAPGPGAAAYSASKAALNQLARVAALEWGSDGIRVNSLHPNAVFDTGIWTDEVLQARAAHYGLTVEQYKTNNVLRVEVHSRDVAELAAELCGPLFRCTTGAQIPVDGGNERVI